MAEGHLMMRMLKKQSRYLVSIHLNYPLSSLTVHLDNSSVSLTTKNFRNTSGVSSVWTTENFGATLHPNATEHEIKRYARVWLWHF